MSDVAEHPLHVDGESDVAEYRLFIDGNWLSSDSGATFDIHRPFDRALYARVAASGKADGRAAVEAADAAFPEWAAMPPAGKAALFRSCARIIERRRAEIAQILSQETGTTLLVAMLQQQIVIQALEAAAAWVYHVVGEVFPSDVPGLRSMSVRRPLGVVACFTPWNGASVLAWRAVLQPLAAGNTVVVKPSEFAPISAGLIIAQVAEEAGFPKGVINVIPHAPGAAGEIADAFFESDAVRCINLIGGVKTARILAERAGRTLKRTVLELGGYNCLVVLDDADVDLAVRTAVFGAFVHQGQVCSCTRKVIVHRTIYDKFVNAFVAHTKTLPSGDPSNPQTIIGPLITPQAVKSVDSAIADAVSRGATVRTGGKCEGQVYEPTILTDVPRDALISCEETFGPVVVVEPFDTDVEALAIANRGNYGLTSAVITRDTYRGMEFGSQLRAGGVFVNGPTVPADEAHVPMGGVRDSGWGRTGPDSVNDFTDLVWITTHSGDRKYPF